MVAGSDIAEVADLSTMRARIYVQESEMRDVHLGEDTKLQLDSGFGTRTGKVDAIAPASSEIAPGLSPKIEYKGIKPPMYYAVSILQPNPDGALRDGMTGTVRIYSGRRSVMGFIWKVIYEFVARKLW